MDKDNLLLFGYIREYQEHNKLSHLIPDPIIFIIIAYYARRFEVYCVCNSNKNQFLIEPDISEKLISSYLSNYVLSTRLSEQCTDISSITACSSYTIIKNFNNNNIFISGSNIFNQKKGIDCFENLGVKLAENNDSINDIFQCNNDYIDVISKGIWSVHSILISKKCKFYASKDTGCNASDLESFFNNNSLRIKAISCGGRYSLFICNNGTVYSHGVNNRGQCGLDNTLKTNKNIQIPTLIQFTSSNDDIVKIKDISSGSSHNIAVTTNGDLYVFGWNTYGQIGIKRSEHSNDHICIPRYNQWFKNINVDMVECGAWHSVVIDKNGYCYLFGYNANGQIGNGTGHGNIYQPFMFKYEQKTNIKIKSGSCGFRHTLLLSKDDKIKENECIYSFGRNEQKQCSVKSKLTKIILPYKLTKQEIGIHINTHIERVIASPYSTIIVTTL